MQDIFVNPDKHWRPVRRVIGDSYRVGDPRGHQILIRFYRLIEDTIWLRDEFPESLKDRTPNIGINVTQSNGRFRIGDWGNISDLKDTKCLEVTFSITDPDTGLPETLYITQLTLTGATKEQPGIPESMSVRTFKAIHAKHNEMILAELKL